MSSKTKTTATKEEATPALVPKLRFPEFRDAEAWRKEALGDLMEITSSKRVHESDWAEAGVPFYRAREIVALNNGEPITPLFITEDLYRENAKRSGEIVPGDLLVSGVGSIGIPYLVKPNDRFYFKDGNIIWLKNRGTKLQGQFLLTLYGTQFVQSQIKTMAGVGTVGTYTIDNANKTVVVFPVDDIEQQKVAECLSSVDELMAAQARKLDALKTHKKGLMQQLFPREGETQPRLRFPEFQNAGEWEEQPLKKVFSIFQGFAFSSGDSVKQGCRWLKIADVGIQVMNHEAPSFLPEAYKERFSKFAVRAGDYVVALTRPILSGQLKIAKVDDVFDGALLNQRVGKLITSQHPAFVFLLLQTKKLIGDIERSISGNDPPNLSAQQIEGIKTYVPRPAEQQRIATCLSSLDALITAENQKHEALKTHKKALMQQLFPSPEEVEA